MGLRGNVMLVFRTPSCRREVCGNSVCRSLLSKRSAGRVPVGAQCGRLQARRFVGSSSAGCTYCGDAVLRALAQAAVLHSFGCLLLSDDLSGVELDKHGAVGFDLLNRNREAKIVQEQELQFQVVKLR